MLPRLAGLSPQTFDMLPITADAIDDIPRHFASLGVARLRLVLRDRYEIACDAADVVRTLKGSSAAESPT